MINSGHIKVHDGGLSEGLNGGLNSADHFVDVNKTITMPKGVVKEEMAKYGREYEHSDKY